MDDWDWDSINLLATPKPGIVVTRQTACSSQTLAGETSKGSAQAAGCSWQASRDGGQCSENSSGCQALRTSGLPMIHALMNSSIPDFATRPVAEEQCTSDGSAGLQEVSILLADCNGIGGCCSCASSPRGVVGAVGGRIALRMTLDPNSWLPLKSDGASGL